MKIANKIFIILGIACCIISCEKYEEYITDYDYIAVYFGAQNQKRTIVANNPMTTEIGVVLAGKRENTKDETVTFSIDPTLLDDSVRLGADTAKTSAFTVLPSAYYSLSHESTITIPKGKHMGSVTLTFDRAAFTADPLALGANYVLPIVLTGTSVDTILQGDEANPSKDYAIIAFKYISPYEGNFYQKGAQYIGSTLDTLYSKKSLNKNKVVDLSTVSADVVTVGAVGNFGDDMILTVNNDNSVALSTAGGSSSTITQGSGTYSPDEKTFILSYSFDRGGTSYSVKDTLVHRNTDIKIEFW